MLKILASAALAVIFGAPASAAIVPYPAAFHTQMIATNGIMEENPQATIKLVTDFLGK